ncbi:oxidoreductase, short-chain dehydrogenase/reductase family [Diplocarpon rosae]|nr:oxidoreductase, short-chain dehydrogenase/reductase family [Diplocarpon rosae]
MSQYDTELQDFPNIFSLKGKVVVVTGGSRGLGLHAASGFLQAGASKVYITSRKASACESAIKTLNILPNLASGAKAISVPADISKFEGVEHLLKEATFGYSASKAAAIHLAKNLAVELGPRHILVNAIAPGLGERGHGQFWRT